MSTTGNSPYSYFRRRTIGRAASPPTWACYEQIPDDDDDDYSDSQSEDDSCSEDGEDYSRASHAHHLDGDHAVNLSERQDDTQNMEIDEVDHSINSEKDTPQCKKDIKGKQRAVEPEPQQAKRRHHKRERRRPTYTLRPILTIQKSQGFVWNQDLFVPPYIKDRYVASTSPPGSRGVSNSWSSTASSMTDYEVEVVEIRVRDDELYDIIP
ncbi:hypothetical protein F5I97DRAFT_1892436 [Phlebopus sp. FC_14]|nr:hypothetical protein F5I97DRAFT_1892436 [Phlebopus sp. FC_14]